MLSRRSGLPPRRTRRTHARASARLARRAPRRLICGLARARHRHVRRRGTALAQGGDVFASTTRPLSSATPRRRARGVVLLRIDAVPAPATLPRARISSGANLIAKPHSRTRASMASASGVVATVSLSSAGPSAYNSAATDSAAPRRVGQSGDLSAPRSPPVFSSASAAAANAASSSSSSSTSTP